MRKTLRSTRLLAALAGLAGLLLATPLVRAQDNTQTPADDNSPAAPDENYSNDANDPPTRVARISYLDGSVSFQPGGEGDWGAAAKNRPVTIGDKIWVDKESRAELEAGQASIHLGSMTALSFLNLNDNTTQMRLAEGSINFRVRELREGDVYEVDTPNGAFVVKQAGAFRIDVSEQGDGMRVTVLRGEGEVTAAGKTYEIHPNERGEFNGTDDIKYSITPAAAPDGLDRWANERDLKEDNSISAKYVNRDTVGYSDLDDYGTWSEVPDYGHVWYPTVVDAGWAPYSWGYWSYVGPWGWTWVDYAPWGFAPFHYGRWAFVGGRWGWCPGPYWARPVYGPAFVGFFGGGGWGVGFGFGFGGGVGWFPLGWGEPYRPWFHCGPRYLNVINVHNTFIRNANVIHQGNFNYAYARNTRAVTVASRSAFEHGQMVNRGAFHVNEAQLRNARFTNNPGGNPTRESRFGAANLSRNVARPSAAVQSRAVFARSAPARGAANIPVHTMSTGNLSPVRGGNTSGAAANRPAGEGANSPMRSNAPQPGGNANGPAGQAGGAFHGAGGAQNGRQFNDRPPSARPGANGSVPVNNSGMHSPRSFEGQGGMSGRAPVSNAQNGRQFNDRPPSARPGSNSRASGGRAWEAQGSATDRGAAPRGFGQNDRPSRGNSNGTAESARMNHSDRPVWAGNGGNASSNRPNYSNGGSRSYTPPAVSGDRGYSRQPSGNRGYSQPGRSYGSAPGAYSGSPRTYSPPSRGYPSSGRGGSYSAPSHSYGGSGGGRGGYSAGASHGSTGGGSRGGGSSHGGGSTHGGRH